MWKGLTTTELRVLATTRTTGTASHWCSSYFFPPVNLNIVDISMKVKLWKKSASSASVCCTRSVGFHCTNVLFETKKWHKKSPFLLYLSARGERMHECTEWPKNSIRGCAMWPLLMIWKQMLLVGHHPSGQRKGEERRERNGEERRGKQFLPAVSPIGLNTNVTADNTALDVLRPQSKMSGFLSEIWFLSLSPNMCLGFLLCYLIIASQKDFNTVRVPSCFYSGFQYSFHKTQQGGTISVSVSGRNAFKGATQNERYSQQFFIFICPLMNRDLFVKIHGWC